MTSHHSSGRRPRSLASSGVLLAGLALNAAGCGGEPCIRERQQAPRRIEVLEGPATLSVSCSSQEPVALRLTDFYLAQRLSDEWLDRHSLQLIFGNEQAPGDVTVTVEVPPDLADGAETFHEGDARVDVSAGYADLQSRWTATFLHTTDLPASGADLASIPEDTEFTMAVELTLDVDLTARASGHTKLCRNEDRTLRMARTRFRLTRSYFRDVCYDDLRLGGH